MAASTSRVRAILAKRGTAAPSRKVRKVAAPVIVAVIVLAVWQSKLAHALFGFETFAVPLPLDILDALSQERSELLARTGESLIPGVIGFVLGELLGFLLAAVLVALPARLGRQVTLLGAAIQSLPAVALVALVAFWVKDYTLVKVAVVAIMVSPSMLVYAYRGLTSTRLTALELMESYNASSTRVLRSVRLPCSVPHLFTQVKYAVTIMLVAVVLSEIIVTGDGLGYEIEHSLSQFDAPIAWAAVSVLAFVGVVTYALASVIERIAFPWAARQQP